MWVPILTLVIKNVAFFSELAHTLDQGFAITAGVISNLTARLDVSLLLRKFDRNYQSFYSNALSESSTPQK
jgi:hypothetical protein